MSDVKPCPLCGAKAGLDDSYLQAKVFCTGCGVFVEKHECLDLEDLTLLQMAIDDWNDLSRLSALSLIGRMIWLGCFGVDHDDLQKSANKFMSEISKSIGDNSET